jgi:IS30 family transposase
MKTGYKQLGIEDREKIAIYRAQYKSIREIARLTGRSHATISRELRRNAPPVHPSDYRPYRAQLTARRRKQKSGERMRLKDLVIQEYVHEKLKKGWSPEQIAGRISVNLPGRSICYEAIYQYAYIDAPELIRFLPRRHRKRRVKSSYRKTKPLPIPNRIMIQDRPQEISRRASFGHWEADSMVSRASKTVAHVLVERKSRFVRITKIPRNTAPYVRETIIRRLGYPCHASSITYDNGLENVQHEKVNELLKTQSYFCQPYHSWEKGTVENTIGLVRRLIPKKTDLAGVSTKQFRRVENLLNNRPRKCLNYCTPREVFTGLSGALAR